MQKFHHESTNADHFWQDPQRQPIDDLCHQLELRAHTKYPMANFALCRAELRGINLVNRSSKQGYQLTNSDLYRANLENAHLFKLDLSGSSLMKANFTHANLHYANLSGCNLLGAKFTDAKIENVNWGACILQEQQAAKATTYVERIDFYEQAEEVYRNLRQTAENRGLFETAGAFFCKEMVMRRKQMPKYSVQRILSKLVEYFCGYGEHPNRVIGFSILLILLFAALYFFVGLSANGNITAFDTSISPLENTKHFFSALYFSVVTFTTLGYGDLVPIGIARALAALEAFLGSFTLALFVVVFVKKMTR
ncbi:ion channel [Alteromonadaceae bacterium BrNp21-10]|nr:ion channel [Alteromonadaceae bacterium BrNp21-10]